MLWRGGVRWLAVLLPAVAVSLPLGYLAREMGASRRGVIGWPLAWALSLSPLPLLRIFPLDHDIAFGTGLAVQRCGERRHGRGARRSRGPGDGTPERRAPRCRPFRDLAALGSVSSRGTGRGPTDSGTSTPASTSTLSRFLPRASWWPSLCCFALYSRPRRRPSSDLSSALRRSRKLAGLASSPSESPFSSSSHTGFGEQLLALGGLVSLPHPDRVLAPRLCLDQSSGKGIDAGTLYRWSYVLDNVRDSPVFTGPMLILLLPLAALGIIVVRGCLCADLARLDSGCHGAQLRRLLRHQPAPTLLLCCAAGVVPAPVGRRRVDRRASSASGSSEARARDVNARVGASVRARTGLQPRGSQLPLSSSSSSSTSSPVGPA